MAKTLQPYPKQSKISELHELTFLPIFGSLRTIICFGPFYKFVSLSLMVLYHFESIHLDDSNLIYSQNKNRGYTEILTAFSLLYNMILMPSIQILFFSNQFQCIIPQFHKSLTNFNISYKIQHQTLTIHSLDFFSNPNLIHFFINFYQIHHDSTLNTPIGVLSTNLQQIKGLCDLSTKTLGLEQTNLHRKTLAITPITLDIQKTLDSMQKKKKHTFVLLLLLLPLLPLLLSFPLPSSNPYGSLFWETK